MNDLPSFLIIWAAKCWSTSLFKYLWNHENVFLSIKKEPEFFINEIVEKNHKWINKRERYQNNMVKDINQYKECYNWSNQESLNWEASIWYSYFHNIAIPKIKQIIWDPKIIMILRDPTERTYSLRKHIVQKEFETKTFRKCLELEEQHIQNNHHHNWHLIQSSLYFEQIRAFIENFSDVHIIQYEKFIANKNKTVKEALEFLWLESDIKLNTHKNFNRSVKPRERSYWFVKSDFYRYMRMYQPRIIKALLNKLFFKEFEPMNDSDRDFVTSKLKDDTQATIKLLKENGYDFDPTLWKNFS